MVVGSDYPFPLGDLAVGAFIENSGLDKALQVCTRITIRSPSYHSFIEIQYVSEQVVLWKCERDVGTMIV